MHKTRSMLTVTAVAFVLGILVVAQLRSQQGTPGLAGLSAQSLTVVVANLNTGNEGLRGEVASLERELRELGSAQDRGASSVDRLREDLLEVRGFTGAEAVSGPGVAVTVDGPIGGAAVGELLNELRNAGSEAIAIDEVRIVAGSVVAGPPGGLQVDGTVLGDPFEVRAIGSPETLTGSLTRIGGLVAQLAATEPLATLTVTPVERLLLPATERNLVPRNGRPRL